MDSNESHASQAQGVFALSKVPWRRPLGELRPQKTITKTGASALHDRPDSPALMKTIDEMLHLALLTPDQHQQISAWIAQADTPDEILKMPSPLWQAVERASAVMGVDEDLMRPPSLDADDAVCQ